MYLEVWGVLVAKIETVAPRPTGISFFFEIGVVLARFVAKIHLFHMFRGRPFQYFLFKHQQYNSYSPANFFVILPGKINDLSLWIYILA